MIAPMHRSIRVTFCLSVAFSFAGTCVVGSAEGISVIHQRHDPYGYPRPGAGQANVPLGTSFYVVIGTGKDDTSDQVLAESASMYLLSETGKRVDVVRPGVRFASGRRGSVSSARARNSGRAMTIYADGGEPLAPSTTYRVFVAAKSKNGFELPESEASWTFTTEAARTVHSVRFDMNLDLAGATRWHGAHFSGFVKPAFCTSDPVRLPGYDLMAEVRKKYPKGWSLQRDAWMTGTEHRPMGMMPKNLPNVVRELETRRISKIAETADGVVLHVEDFFGHEQYGIPSGRPLGPDYCPGDEVLIADGVSDARAKVIRSDDEARTVLVTPFDSPKGGWFIEYAGPLPKKENPAAPGLFASGGCYLRKFDPSGTARYWWGRIHKEWDIACGKYGRRVVPRFADAPGDLSIDGRAGTTAKDYLQLREVTYAFTTHLVERYGDACLDFPWTVFNEPDLARVFWRVNDWEALQIFYDYTVDGILRAFEDHGYDSNRVMVGGLEIGAIFGTRIEKPILGVFLAHCSPTAKYEGALDLNAAFADKRLDGKRSKRVENLCRANNGRGAPCDFISVHAYNGAKMAADKLIRGKEIALRIDADYYRDLWVNSFEAITSWAPPPDPAAADSFLGNGYFASWCADVERRLLERASRDARYGFGETILTFWPSPNRNFRGGNAFSQIIDVDDDGDWLADRSVTIPLPVFHMMTLLNSTGEDYWVLPEKRHGGHVISGFGARTESDVRILVYSHHEGDTQARSEAAFDVALRLTSLPWDQIGVDEHRFDKDHNSYFRTALKLRDRKVPASKVPAVDSTEFDRAVLDLESDSPETVAKAVGQFLKWGARARTASPALKKFIDKNLQGEERQQATAALWKMMLGTPPVYTRKEVAEVQKLARLNVTRSTRHSVSENGVVSLNLRVGANGANFLVIASSEE